MSQTKNAHYAGIIERSKARSDSPLEIGELVSYDKERMVGNVLGLRSKEVRKDTIITFPGMFMGKGVMSFPVNKSKGLLYVGPENQSYFLPAQFHLPTMEVEGGEAKFNASPRVIDPLVDLDNYEQGEVLLASLGNAKLVLRNDGTISLATPNGHTFSLEDDGDLNLLIEREVKRIANSEFFCGTKFGKDGQELFVIENKIVRNGLGWKTGENLSLEQALEVFKTGDYTQRVDADETVIISEKKVNVLDENDNVLLDGNGDTFYELKEIKGEAGTSYKKQHSYKQNVSETFESATHKLAVELSPGKASVNLSDKNSASSVTITMTNGDVTFNTSEGSLSVNELIRFLRGV